MFFIEMAKKCFPGGSDGKESACNAGEQGSIPGPERSPGEGWHPTPVFLPGEFHGQRGLVGYSPWGPKESDTTEWLTLSLSKKCLLTISLHHTVKGKTCPCGSLISHFWHKMWFIPTLANSATLAGCLAVQFGSDTPYLELASEPSVPQGFPHP